MKQSIQLRLGQHLTMTPQLQQAIRLLQLSTVELNLEIQQALESNMMLEMPEGEGSEGGVDDADRFLRDADNGGEGAAASEAPPTSASEFEASAEVPDRLDSGTTSPMNCRSIPPGRTSTMRVRCCPPVAARPARTWSSRTSAAPPSR
jgi:RNA polymerase sigma-54 factor